HAGDVPGPAQGAVHARVADRERRDDGAARVPEREAGRRAPAPERHPRPLARRHGQGARFAGPVRQAVPRPIGRGAEPDRGGGRVDKTAKAPKSAKLQESGCLAFFGASAVQIVPSDGTSRQTMTTSTTPEASPTPHPACPPSP